MSDKTNHGILDGIPPGKAGTILAMKVADAVHEPKRADVAAAHAALETLFRERFAAAPGEVRDAILGKAAEDSPLALAYLLGQVSQAQTIVAGELNRRPDEGFEEAFEDPAVTAILDTLGHAQLGIPAIVRETGFKEADVRNTLGRLTHLGIVDHRRGWGENAPVEYFATPIAFMHRPIFNPKP